MWYIQNLMFFTSLKSKALGVINSVKRLLLLLLLLLLLFNLLKNTEHAYNNNELSIRESSLHNSLTITTWHKGAVKTQFVATLYGNR